MKKMWMVLFVSGLVMSLVGVSVSQTEVKEEWQRMFGGSTEDFAYRIARDASGNIYVTGTSYSPYAILTTSYDADGNLRWADYYQGDNPTLYPAKGVDIAVGSDGCVYVAGDAGIRYQMKPPLFSRDLVVIKYSSNGGRLWVKSYNYHPVNHYSEYARALTLDAQDNVYITGQVDLSFDPQMVRDRGWITVSYSSGSGFRWANMYNYNDPDRPPGYPYDGEDPVDIAVDNNGQFVYVTGHVLYYDPEPPPVCYNKDWATIQYDAGMGGNPRYVALYRGLQEYLEDIPKAITVDPSGDPVVTGYVVDSDLHCATVKYDRDDFHLLWAARHSSVQSYGADVAVDASGDVFVAGTYSADIGVEKYRSGDGGSIWYRAFETPGLVDQANALALDGFGDVYVTGPNLNGNYFTIKYRGDTQPGEEELWYIISDGGSIDQAKDIVVDQNGNVYVTGFGVSPAGGNDYFTVKYSQFPQGRFDGCKTDISQGRHLVRDPFTQTLYLVMHRVNDNAILYTRSSDSGTNWDRPIVIGQGENPTVGLAYPLNQYDPVVCVTYKALPPSNARLLCSWYDPMVGQWQSGEVSTDGLVPEEPSLVVTNPGGRVFVAYSALTGGGSRYVFCKNFWYNNPEYAVTEIVETVGNPVLPCLAVDGENNVHAAWRRILFEDIYYSKRENGVWWTPTPVYPASGYSLQPFVECFAESVFVVWSEYVNPQLDVFRAAKGLGDYYWYEVRNFRPSSQTSESPVQAWREFTVWSEAEDPQYYSDIWYWSQRYNADKVEANNTEWSKWPHSQMASNDLIMQTDLWTAWTELNRGNGKYRVLVKSTPFWGFGFGPGEELSDYGCYYKVLAGQDSVSRYCQKRDGVFRFGERAVDFSRDSLIYELPYLDPNYDYFVRVASYRETGEDWVQALSMEGGPARSVRFAPNQVDTAWVQVPPEAYNRDRKVKFVLKNVRGDYVTSLGLTLFQRDPKSRRKGGPQAGEPLSVPAKDVFSVYPNPARGQAQVEYSLKTPGEVKLTVYDITGRLIRNLVGGRLPAGVHKAVWDGKTETGKATQSGVYFVRLNTPEAVKTTRFVVIR